MVLKRDAENTRLRDQREQQAAELNERKQKDGVKLASTKELQALAEARSASRTRYLIPFDIDLSLCRLASLC